MIDRAVPTILKEASRNAPQMLVDATSKGDSMNVTAVRLVASSAKTLEVAPAETSEAITETIQTLPRNTFRVTKFIITKGTYAIKINRTRQIISVISLITINLIITTEVEAAFKIKTNAPHPEKETVSTTATISIEDPAHAVENETEVPIIQGPTEISQTIGRRNIPLTAINRTISVVVAMKEEVASKTEMGVVTTSRRTSTTVTNTSATITRVISI